MQRIKTIGVGIAFFVSAGLQTALAQQILINGTGSTFGYPVYSKWADLFHKKYPNIEINYSSTGSGAGIARVTDGTVDFGASDGPMSDAEMKAFRDKNGCGVLHFPTALGAEVPVYKLAGENVQLSFTGQILAAVYLGKITKWNDPAITAANPGVKLPNHNIVVVHRSDSSGTTYVFTDYLAKVDPAGWKSLFSKQPNWPVGLGGQGNEGVAGMVQNTPYSIGYVELTYALQNKMQFGKMKNESGENLEATLAGVTTAADAVAKSMPADFRVSITDAPGKGAYPISTYTYILVPEKIKDPAKKKAIIDFLKWMLTDGQADSVLKPIDYAPLPKSVATREIQQISKIQ